MPGQAGPRWVRNIRLAAYLDVTTMTVWRWQRDSTLKFPQPTVINGNPFTNLDDIDEWMKRRVVDKATKVA